VHDVDNNPWVQLSLEDAKDAVHSFPVVSATITSYARVKILDALMVNATSIVYCDTDSIKVIDEVRGVRGYLSVTNLEIGIMNIQRNNGFTVRKCMETSGKEYHTKQTNTF